MHVPWPRVECALTWIGEMNGPHCYPSDTDAAAAGDDADADADY